MDPHRREHDDLVEPLFGALRDDERRGAERPRRSRGAGRVLVLLALSALLLWWIAS